MNVEECYYLGYTSKSHGKNGELIAKIDVDFPEEYNNLESVLVRMNKTDKTLIPFFISQAQIQNNGTLRFKFEDVNNVVEAKSLVGKELYLPLDTLPKLTGDKFYFHEVIGFTVIDHQKGNIGEIFNVLEHPQQAIFEVRFNSKEILIPITDDIINKVDRINKTIEVSAPEGLIDIYLD